MAAGESDDEKEKEEALPDKGVTLATGVTNYKKEVVASVQM